MDPIYVPVFLLVIAITIFLSFYVWTTFSTNITPILNGTNAVTVGNQNKTLEALTDIQTSFDSFDYAFPFLVGGLMIVSLVFAYKRGASVIYTVISIVAWALALLLSAVFTNIFGSFQTTFPSVAASLPIITYIMNNMKWIVIFWLALIALIMFTRDKKEDQQIASAERVFT